MLSRFKHAPDIIPLRIIFYNYNVISINMYYFWFSTDTLVVNYILATHNVESYYIF